MKTILLLTTALLLSSCIAPRQSQQSSFDPYAVYQHDPSIYQPKPKPTSYHVEPSGRGYDITPY